MRYVVRGANRNSGGEVTVTLDAKSATDAERKAQDLGVLVAEVKAEKTLLESGTQLLGTNAPPGTSAPLPAPSHRVGTPICFICGAATLTRSRSYMAGPAIAIVGILFAAMGALWCGLGLFQLAKLMSQPEAPKFLPLAGPQLALAILGGFGMFALSCFLSISRRCLRCYTCSAEFPAR